MLERQNYIDARGEYKPEGREIVQISEPEDLVQSGIQITENAIVKTWGYEGLGRYLVALENARTEAALDTSKWGPIPSYGTLIDDGQTT